MKLFLFILFFCSCSKEYSVENIPDSYEIVLVGTGNDVFPVQIPGYLVGQKVTISFYLTLYASKTDSIGRNDFIEQLPMGRTGIEKYAGNPVYKNRLVLQGKIVLPDVLFYYTTTYYVGTVLPGIRDSIKIEIKKL